jgi:hypothetical protein
MKEMPHDELQKVSDILAGIAKAKPAQDKRPGLMAPSKDEMQCPYCQGEGCKKCDDEDESEDEEDAAQKDAMNKVIVILLDGSEED